jgi:hypothetical protein
LAKWLAGIALVAAISLGAAWAADLWVQLGMTEAQAKQAAPEAWAGGSVPFYMAARAVMAAPPAARAVLVVEVLKWTKAYLATAEFKAAYGTLREDRKPSPPASAAEEAQKRKAEQDQARKQQEEARKAMAQMPPEVRKQIEEAMKAAEAMQKQMAGDPELAARLKEAEAEEAKNREREYKESLAKWEQDYPANANVLIARRLREFLTLSAEVDFNAKLVKRYAKMAFADERFESKSSEWKLCYRAGRETVEAARAFVTTWLPELEKR